MRGVKAVLRNWVPPIAVQQWRKWAGSTIRFDGPYPDWSSAAAASSGYDAANILATSLQAALQVKSGLASYERDGVLFHQAQYNHFILSHLGVTAALHGGELSTLDVGGGLGSTYFQHAHALRGLRSLRWGIVEQPHFVEAGQTHLRDGMLDFYESIDSACRDFSPQVILLSSVLQYVDDPWSMLRQASQTSAQRIIMDRTPVCEGEKDMVCVQHVPSGIYAASYPMRALSWPRFMDVLGSRWSVVDSQVSPEGGVCMKGGGAFEFRGVCWERSPC